MKRKRLKINKDGSCSKCSDFEKVSEDDKRCETRCNNPQKKKKLTPQEKELTSQLTNQRKEQRKACKEVGKIQDEDGQKKEEAEGKEEEENKKVRKVDGDKKVDVEKEDEKKENLKE